MRLPWISRKQSEEEIARLEEKIDGIMHEMAKVYRSVEDVRDDKEAILGEVNQEINTIKEAVLEMSANTQTKAKDEGELARRFEEVMKGTTSTIQELNNEFEKKYQDVKGDIANINEAMSTLASNDEILSNKEAEVTQRLEQGMKDTNASLNRLFKGLNVVYKAGTKLEGRFDENVDKFQEVKERFQEIDQDILELKGMVKDLQVSRPGSGLSQTDTRGEVLDWLKKDPSLTENDLALLLGRKRDSVAADIESLKADGYLTIPEPEEDEPEDAEEDKIKQKQ